MMIARLALLAFVLTVAGLQVGWAMTPRVNASDAPRLTRPVELRLWLAAAGATAGIGRR
jgi:hypothetical protein